MHTKLMISIRRALLSSRKMGISRLFIHDFYGIGAGPGTTTLARRVTVSFRIDHAFLSPFSITSIVAAVSIADGLEQEGVRPILMDGAAAQGALPAPIRLHNNDPDQFAPKKDFLCTCIQVDGLKSPVSPENRTTSASVIVF